ncbi:E3 ubiquitin-protein ligase synoviolin-A [Trichinella spiralis]|uniref:E3 ubiquitin-protein ligase synoviolin-A n=1 Tax=Trichinella spiralis TaxID=6334 RepID=UPI0001EFBBE8|nr:E3 ubiquitin-protein ligase synoviolin-A [Trichinella spiralis]
MSLLVNLFIWRLVEYFECDFVTLTVDFNGHLLSGTGKEKSVLVCTFASGKQIQVLSAVCGIYQQSTVHGHLN